MSIEYQHGSARIIPSMVAFGLEPLAVNWFTVVDPVQVSVALAWVMPPLLSRPRVPWWAGVESIFPSRRRRTGSRICRRSRRAAQCLAVMSTLLPMRVCGQAAPR
jgi:hypothetical protein